MAYLAHSKPQYRCDSAADKLRSRSGRRAGTAGRARTAPACSARSSRRHPTKSFDHRTRTGTISHDQK